MGTFAVGERNKMLDAVSGRAAYTASAAFYAQLHTGDPGAAGTTNVSTETTRKLVTFGTGAATGSIASTADTTWTNIATSGTETITHVSFWTASTSGTFLGSDDLPAGKSVNTGDTFRIASGDITLSIA